LLLGFYLIALQRETSFTFQRAYLLTGLILSLLIPTLSLDTIYYQGTDPLSDVISISQGIVEFTSETTSIHSENGIPWQNLILIAYSIISVLLAIRCIKEIYTIFTVKNSGTKTVIEGTTCLVSNKVKSPFSFFNVIYLPLTTNLTQEEISRIVKHEQAHVAGVHSIDIILLEIIQILFWPNPFLILYKRKLREVHEFIADRAVIRETSWESYAELLLRFKECQIHARLTHHLMYSQLKTRIIMMTKSPSSKWAQMKFAGLLPLAFLLLTLFSFKDKSGISSFDSQNLLQVSDPAYPVFPGCENVAEAEKQQCTNAKLLAFIQHRLVYPVTLTKEGIEGKVIVRFSIDEDGLVSNIRIEKSLHPEADRAVIAVFDVMNEEVGKWVPAQKNGKPFETEMVLPVTFASDNKVKEDNTMQNIADEMPRFPGCEHLPYEQRNECAQKALYAYINTILIYPKEAKDKKQEGAVYAGFTVTQEGALENIRIMRGVNPVLDNEVLRVIESMNTMDGTWIPGKKNGKVVPIEYTLPVRFKLDDK
jgi:TonB family protein